MKKIGFLSLVLFLITGCELDPIEKIKKLSIDGCTSESFEESVNLYINKASWEKDGTKYIIKGKNAEDKEVIINAIIKDKKVKIERFIVDKVNITDNKDEYMAKVCSRYADSIENNKGEDNTENKGNTENNTKPESKPVEKPSTSVPDITTSEAEHKTPPKEEIKVEEPKPSENPAVVKTNAACGVELINVNGMDATLYFTIYAENGIVTDMEAITYLDTGLEEISAELMDEFREEFFSIKAVDGITRGVAQEDISTIRTNVLMDLRKINKNSSEDMKIIKDYFGEFDYNNPTLDSVIAYYESLQAYCKKSS